MARAGKGLAMPDKTGNQHYKAGALSGAWEISDTPCAPSALPPINAIIATYQIWHHECCPAIPPSGDEHGVSTVTRLFSLKSFGDYTVI